MKKSLLAGLLVAVAGCYPGEVTTLSDTDIVMTFQNPETNYSQLLTYAMPDTVVQLDEDSSAVQIDHSFDGDIVARVKSRLGDYGWTEVTFPADTPDVFVLASVVADEYTSYTYYPGYWWGSWGWYYPPCVYCYPGYPPTVSVTKFKAGTLFLDMLETATINPADSTVRFAWTAAMNGVLGSSAAGNAQRALDGINTAFLQSQYLDKSN
jgi:hypothetical protein